MKPDGNPERKPVRSQHGTEEGDTIGDILRRLGLARKKEAQALGLQKGTYQQLAHSQLDALMQKDQPEHVRYYAWLLRQSMGFAIEPHSTNKKLGTTRYHGRCAMKMERGRKVPATQMDASRDLFMERANVNRAQANLEALGWARRATTRDGRVLLFCYVRPAKKGRKHVISPDNMIPSTGRFSISYKLPEVNWSIRIDCNNVNPVINPENRPIVEAACKSLMEEMLQEYRERLEAIIPTDPVIKQTPNVLSAPITAIRKKETERNTVAKQQQQPAAVVDRSTNWPKSLGQARTLYPRVGPGFIDKVAAKGCKIRPGLTDDELVNCLTKRSKQLSEGLWMVTIVDDMAALNAGRSELSPRDIIERAKAEERERGK